jgi:hypothetical protein
MDGCGLGHHGGGSGGGGGHPGVVNAGGAALLGRQGPRKFLNLETQRIVGYQSDRG